MGGGGGFSSQMSALPAHTGGPSLPTGHLPAPAFSERRAGACGLPGSRMVASCACGPWRSSPGVPCPGGEGAGPESQRGGKHGPAGHGASPSARCSQVQRFVPLSGPSWGAARWRSLLEMEAQGRRCSTPGHRAPRGAKPSLPWWAARQERPRQRHSQESPASLSVPWGPFVRRGQSKAPPPSWS